MSAGIWLYNEKICEGHECIKDCDHCSYADKVFEGEEKHYTKTIYETDEQKEKLKKWLQRLAK